jgi:hypothetical protein
MIHHSYRGITGQELWLVVTNNTTVSWGMVYPYGLTSRIHPWLRLN